MNNTKTDTAPILDLDISDLRREAFKDRCLWSAFFFTLFRKSIASISREAGSSNLPRPKRSPFIYNLR